MLKFILGFPVDAAYGAWLAFRWLVLSPGMYAQEDMPWRLILVRALALWAVAALVFPSFLPSVFPALFPPSAPKLMVLAASVPLAAPAGYVAALAATVLQAFLQAAWSDWSDNSGRY